VNAATGAAQSEGGFTMTGKLTGKVALVTGGSAGIGLGIAKCFAAEGAHVFITGRRESELDKAVTAIGGNAAAVQGDISNLGQPHCARTESTLYLRRTCCGRRMTQMGHEDRFRSPSLSGRSRWGEATFARMRGNRRDAPKAAELLRCYCDHTSPARRAELARHCDCCRLPA
jgi:hypothetical protein